MIILIIALSAGIAYAIANAVFGSMTQEGVTVKTIDVITGDIVQPDPAIFNQEAINPTVEVQVTDNQAQTSNVTE